MNRKSLARQTVMAIVCGLITIFANGSAYSQSRPLPLEEVTFSYGTISAKRVYIRISVQASSARFLADPVQTLRQNRLAVPQSAEAPWREFADALRELTNPQSTSGSRRSGGNETLVYKIELREFQGGIRIALGDVNSGSPSARMSLERFLNDPVRTLRAQGVQVPAGDERAWKQLGDALRALQVAYAKPRARMDRESSDNPDSTAPNRTPDARAADRNARVGNGREPRRDPRPTPARGVDPERGQNTGRMPAPRTPPAQGLATGQQPTLDKEALEQSLHAAIAPNVMGYTFLLIKDGRFVTEGAGGLARNAADGEMKMTTRTPQNLGSLFKFITGVTVLHMLDRAPAGSAGGNNSFETRLGAPVTLLYPQLWNSAIKWPKVRSITFRHLLQHRTGFRACDTPLGCFGKRYNNSLFDVRDYENINFQLLGFLIPLYTNPELIPALNAVTKTVSEDEGDKHIQMVLSDRMDRFINQKMFSLAPGRISASCDAENEYKATGAYGYISKSDKGKGIITSRKAGGKPCVGSGGYWMSIRDFGAFAAAALHSDRMLSQQARLEMYRSGMPADDRLVWSSSGVDSWIADKFKMSTIIQSNGAQPYDGGQGFSTVLLRLPLNYELMVFVNSKGMDTNALTVAGLKAFRAGMEGNFQ
ncbi:MAG TPA: serine hydrolase [Pyrinomonadaceae bacterium]|nr:serine hydrolase [Pyrinomonadaceae bacterium]